MNVPAVEAAENRTRPRSEAAERSHRPHMRMAVPGIARFLFTYVSEMIANIPALFELRAFYGQIKANPSAEPVVACVGDNLDEVNGIALSSRIMLRELRHLGKRAYIFGPAFHTKPARGEGPDDSVVMAPGRFSLDQAGYDASEVAIVRVDAFIRFLLKHHVDVIEFQTPGPVAVQCLIVAKAAGIRTVSHYRTDIITYSKLLVKNRFGVWFINTWTMLMTRWMGPVIVPSEAYRDKVREMGIAADRIRKLPRGVDLRNFHPDKAANGAWESLGLPASGLKLLYVGRISKEKNLDLLADVYPGLARSIPDLSLTVVGEGPYRIGLQARFADQPGVHFTGVVQGENLSGVFASADLLVFPSRTDTFGNSVVEALASGIPCITSNEGGPREIIVDGECGFVFDAQKPGDMAEKILALASDPDRLRAFKEKARERALYFSYDRSAKAFWDFYCERYQQPI